MWRGERNVITLARSQRQTKSTLSIEVRWYHLLSRRSPADELTATQSRRKPEPERNVQEVGDRQKMYHGSGFDVRFRAVTRCGSLDISSKTVNNVVRVWQAPEALFDRGLPLFS